MALNISNIEDALYAWVSAVSSKTAIFAHPNAPRPTSEYILINYFLTTPLGVAEYKADLLPDDSVDMDYSNVEEISVSINTYYSGAYSLATKLKDSLARVTITDALFAAGLGYLRATSIQEIPEEINKQWEERAQFDCFFSVRSLDEENIETIQKVEVTNSINDDGDTVIIEKP